MNNLNSNANFKCINLTSSLRASGSRSINTCYIYLIWTLMCLFDQHSHPITPVLGERIEVIPVVLHRRSFRVEELQIELTEDGCQRQIQFCVGKARRRSCQQYDRNGTVGTTLANSLHAYALTIALAKGGQVFIKAKAVVPLLKPPFGFE